MYILVKIIACLYASEKNTVNRENTDEEGVGRQLMIYDKAFLIIWYF